jgi:hypothetical protein
VYCPFCLGNETLYADKRMKTGTRDADLIDHLENHISKSHWPSPYPHPLCSVQMDDEASSLYHLSDAHSLRKVDKKGQKCCWEVIVLETNDDHQVQKKQKSARPKESVEMEVIEYSPPHSPRPLTASADGNYPCAKEDHIPREQLIICLPRLGLP